MPTIQERIDKSREILDRGHRIAVALDRIRATVHCSVCGLKYKNVCPCCFIKGDLGQKEKKKRKGMRLIRFKGKSPLDK